MGGSTWWVAVRGGWGGGGEKVVWVVGSLHWQYLGFAN